MHRRPAHKQRQEAGTLALRFLACVLFLAAILLLRTFFPTTIDALRERVWTRMEESIDYRGAMLAIGESIVGETPLLEVLGDMTIRAFWGMAPESVEVQAVPEEKEQSPPPEVVLFSLYPPLEQVIYIPEPYLPWLHRSEIEEVPEPIPTPAAKTAFLAHLETFSGHDLPAGVSLSYAPLPIAFTSPIYGYVSSPFGFRIHPLPDHNEVRFHFGVDIARYTGVPFYAFADGYVVEAWECPSFGLYILIDHGYGIFTRYAHANILYVYPGQRVTRGAIIGRVGSTGDSTGPHLHFELIVDGQFRNPKFYVSFDG